MDPWLCWFVVLHGGFHGGVDTGSFMVVLFVVFGGSVIAGFCGDARGGWWWVFILVSDG